MLSPDKLDKLPKYARDHIATLVRQRDEAAARLKAFEDSQTPSKIRYENYIYDDNTNKHRDSTYYVQSDRVIVSHEGVDLEVSVRGDDGIQLHWGVAGCRHALGAIALVPTSYQQARLVNIVYDEDELKRLLQLKQGADREND
jgi:hypothetical protein